MCVAFPHFERTIASRSSQDITDTRSHPYTSQYSISLDLVLKGPMNDLEVKRFATPIICSNVHLGQQQYWHQQQQQHPQQYGGGYQQQQQQYQQPKVDIPAGYWDMAKDFDDAK